MKRFSYTRLIKSTGSHSTDSLTWDSWNQHSLSRQSSISAAYHIFILSTCSDVKESLTTHLSIQQFQIENFTYTTLIKSTGSDSKVSLNPHSSRHVEHKKKHLTLTHHVDKLFNKIHWPHIYHVNIKIFRFIMCTVSNSKYLLTALIISWIPSSSNQHVQIQIIHLPQTHHVNRFRFKALT